jgi:hypothetical protein
LRELPQWCALAVFFDSGTDFAESGIADKKEGQQCQRFRNWFAWDVKR